MAGERSPREEVLNVRLAQLLRPRLDGARPEAPPPGARAESIDVLAEWKGRKIAVEAKKGYSKTNCGRALVQAAERVANGHAKGGVAVCYPEGLTEEDFDDRTRMWACPLDGGWVEMNVETLAGVIRAVSDDLETIEAAGRKFTKNLITAAAHLSEDQTQDIVDAVKIPLGSKQPGLRAALLVASACLFHARLDKALARKEIEKPLVDDRTGGAFDGEGWPFSPLRECLVDPEPVEALTGAWNTILAVDYKPVFETALAALGAPRAYDDGLSSFARRCGYAAQAAAGALAQGQTDLLGRVFHYILDEAENTGAYYTSSAAGTLLAELAVRDEDVDRDLRYSVVDPACGTGTLLAAAAERIRNIANTRGRHAERALVEEVLHGYDIDITATHMAAVALGLMSPSAAFRKMNIRRFPLGWTNDEDGNRTAAIGSLELMDEGRLARDGGWPQSPRARQVDASRRETVRPVRRDLVIMNPPYTGQERRHHHLGLQEKKDVKAREQEVFRMTPAPRSGSSGMFLFLADRLCKKENGTIASVVPASWFGGGSGRQQVWAALLEKYHLETVVTSHDPTRLFFSENTSSSESLIVLRRLNDSNRGLSTRFVNLTANPKTAAEAVPIAADIRSGLMKGTEWPRRKVEAGDWTPVKFSSSCLLDAAVRWFGEKKELGLGTTVGEAAETGPGRISVWSAYTRHDAPDRAGRRALWNNNQNVPARGSSAPPKQTLRAEPDCSLQPKPGKEAEADRLWEQRGRLFVPESLHTAGLRLCAVVSDDPALGGNWMPVKPRRPVVSGWEEAMCVYFNSTVGMFAMLYSAKPNKLTYPKLLPELLKRIPVPDLTDGQAAVLAGVYEEHKNTPIQKMSEQGPHLVRGALDAAVCQVFGWDADEVDSVRREIAKEPRIAGKKRSR